VEWRRAGSALDAAAEQAVAGSEERAIIVQCMHPREKGKPCTAPLFDSAPSPKFPMMLMMPKMKPLLENMVR
jgi:hypothetical protein